MTRTILGQLLLAAIGDVTGAPASWDSLTPDDQETACAVAEAFAARAMLGSAAELSALRTEVGLLREELAEARVLAGEA